MPSYKYQTKSGHTLWFCSFYSKDPITGRNVKHKKSGFETKRASDEWERNYLQMRANLPTVSFQAVADAYLEDAVHLLKPHTLYARRLMCDKYLLPAFGDQAVGDITPASIRAFLLSLDGKMSRSYLATTRALLSTIFAFCVRYYGLPGNPVKSVGKLPSKAKSPDALHYWTPEQFSRFILSELYPEHIAIFSTLFWTGARLGEVQALTRSDVDLSAATISISKTVSYVPPRRFVIQAPKTQAAVRTITIPRRLCAILADWIRLKPSKNDSELLFRIRYQSNLEELFRKHAAKAGLPPIRIHDLRHSHASMLVDMGFPPIVIRDRLGHKDIQTTLNIYSHLYPHQGQDVADALDKI